MADLYDLYFLTNNGDGPPPTFTLSAPNIAAPVATGTAVADDQTPAAPSIAPGSGDTVGDNATETGLTYDGTVTINGITGFIVNNGGTFAIYVPAGAAVTPGASTALAATTWTFATPCFIAGTMIATPDGERAVETLASGDLVMTADGSAKAIRWLGRSTRSTRFADPVRVLPVRIKAGALGESLPTRDLLVSPGHAMLIDGMLVNAGALVNGTSVVRETAMPTDFIYYHVELDGHELLIAEGAATESFLTGVENMGFDNFAERPVVNETAGEMAYPRVKSARQLPRATRDMLAARAAVIAPDVALAA